MSKSKINVRLKQLRLGLGTAQLGNLFRETSDDEVADTLATAWDSGIRYFDTAPHYGLGLSEKRLGAFLKKFKRDEFVISTKVGRLLVPTPDSESEQDNEGFAVGAAFRREWDFSRDGILRSVEESLKRTGLDRFDILYLHDPENHFEQAAGEGISALIELRDQGVVSAVGAGMNYTAPLAELIRRADVDLVMCAGRFTLIDSEGLDELLPLALERNVGVVVAGVYNSGLLSRDRPQIKANFNYLPAPPELIGRVNKIADVCEEYGHSLADVAVAYVTRHPAVTNVVFGARGKNQVLENISRAATEVPEELLIALARKGLIKEYEL